MFDTSEIGKTASTLLCTVLFSATCVLSAVGPARADNDLPQPARVAVVETAPLA